MLHWLSIAWYDKLFQVNFFICMGWNTREGGLKMNMVQFACFSAILARFCFNKRSVCLEAFVSSRQKVIVERRPEWEGSLVLFKTACATVLKPTSLDHYSRRQLVCCTCMDKLVN